MSDKDIVDELIWLANLYREAGYTELHITKAEYDALLEQLRADVKRELESREVRADNARKRVYKAAIRSGDM